MTQIMFSLIADTIPTGVLFATFNVSGEHFFVGFFFQNLYMFLGILFLKHCVSSLHPKWSVWQSDRRDILGGHFR